MHQIYNIVNEGQQLNLLTGLPRFPRPFLASDVRSRDAAGSTLLTVSGNVVPRSCDPKKFNQFFFFI